MKVLTFDLVVHFGGAQRSTLELLQLGRPAIESVVVDAYGIVPEYASYARALALPYEVLCPKPRYARIGHSQAPLRRVIRLVAALPELLRVRKRLRAALLKHRPDVVQVISPKAARLAVWAAQGLPIPIVYWSRGAHVNPAALTRYMKGAISAYVCLSDTTRHASLSLGAPADRTFVVPNAIATERLAVQQPGSTDGLPGPRRKVRLLTAATLLPAKGQATAIRAVAKLVAERHDIALYIAGDAPPGGEDYKRYLYNLRRDLGVEDRVHFLGWRKDIPALLRSSSVFVLGSASEGMPRSVMEAMALGVPVVTTPVGSIPEMLDFGAAGWLFPFDDAEGLAERIRELVADSKDAGTRVANAREIVKSRFDPSITRDRLTTVLARVAASRRRAG